MRRSTKRRLIPLTLALVLAMVGAALAIPGITVNVQKIGSGETAIVAPVGSAAVNYNIDWTSLTVTSVDVSFDVAPGDGSVVQVYIYDSNSNLVGEGQATVSGSSTTSVTVTLSTQPSIFDLDSVKLVVVGPTVSP